ncbi:MAG: hypothetical protein ACREV5_10410 [Steroidobacter sp.]
MNAQMRLVVMLAVLWASGSLLFAAEPAPPAGDEPPASASPAPADEPAAASQKQAEREGAQKPDAAAKDEPIPEEDKDPEPNRASSAADRAGSPQRFTPSEQVRADFDVSFPIDI